MSASYTTAALRRAVATRAGLRCEYCQLPEGQMYYGGQIDHIVSEKHGGATEEENLAFTCAPGNRNKGSDTASLAADGPVTRLFHPRRDNWDAHFFWVGAVIQARTPVAEATLRLLQLNSPPRLLERQLLSETDS